VRTRVASLALFALLCTGCGSSVVNSVLGGKYSKVVFTKCLRAHHATAQNLSLNAVSGRLKSLNPSAATTIAPQSSFAELLASASGVSLLAAEFPGQHIGLFFFTSDDVHAKLISAGLGRLLKLDPHTASVQVVRTGSLVGVRLKKSTLAERQAITACTAAAKPAN
jgi:hypothetical protein